MVMPPVHYTRTPDGFSIAYTVTGAGPVLLMMPSIYGPIEQRRNELIRALYEALETHFTVIQYDGRGHGRSARGITTHSIEDQLSDLEAVVHAVQVAPFFLWAMFWFAPAAVRYVADHPDIVLGLALWNPRPGGARRSTRDEAIAELAAHDWESFLLTSVAASTLANDEPFIQREIEENRRAISQHDYVAMARSHLERPDITPECRKVRIPALILSTDSLPEPEAAVFSENIPGAHAIRFRSMFAAPLQDRMEPTVAAVVEMAGQALANLEPPPVAISLSPRELVVLRLLAAGRSNAAIAVELTLSVRTVERHIANIYGKANVSNRAEATAFAFRHGLT